MSCDFELNLCGWRQSIEDDDFHWRVQQGPGGHSKSGPDVDHTHGNATGMCILSRVLSRSLLFRITGKIDS